VAKDGHQWMFTPVRMHVRYGSKADICAATSHVRSTPNSDRESVIPQKSCLLYPWKRTCAAQLVMSAVGQKRTYAFYSGARALRSGMSEIFIRPLNGSFSSKIK